MTKKKVRSTEYYDLMGIEPDATPEMIKRAYRKKALQLHPDKRGNTPEAQEEFTQMKKAYDVLSDPQKREVYDQAGEDGVKLMENFGSMGPEEMSAALFRSLGAFGPKGKFILIMIVTLLFGFLLLIPIFWCLRIDNIVSWNWAVVFIPLWVVDSIYYCCLGCSLLTSESLHDDETNRTKPTVLKIYYFLKSLLVLVLQIFLAMKLNGDVPSWSLIEVFIPYFVYDGLNFFETLVAGGFAYAMLIKESKGAGMSTTENIQNNQRLLVAAVFVKLLLIASRIVQTVLVGLKVDGTIGCSWWVVFVPLWCYIGYYLTKPIIKYRRSLKKQQNRNSSQQHMPTHDAYARDSTHREDEEEHAKYPRSDMLCSILLILAVTSPFFILASRLQTGDFSAFYVLLPWFIIAGLILCFICCAISCIGLAPPEGAEPGDDDAKVPQNAEGGQADYVEYSSDNAADRV